MGGANEGNRTSWAVVSKWEPKGGGMSATRRSEARKRRGREREREEEKERRRKPRFSSAGEVR